MSAQGEVMFVFKVIDFYLSSFPKRKHDQEIVSTECNDKVAHICLFLTPTLASGALLYQHSSARYYFGNLLISKFLSSIIVVSFDTVLRQ